jgi:hypothetical protein
MGVAGALLALSGILFTAPPTASAQDEAGSQDRAATSIAPPVDMRATDVPNDAGTALKLRWSLSPDDTPDRKPRVVRGYEVYRSQPDGTGHDKIGQVAYGVDEFTDGKCEPGVAYSYDVVAVGAGDAKSAPARLAEPAKAVAQWFDRRKTWFGVILLAVCGAVVLFTELAKGGRRVHVREIAGLRAIEEAVGRATEMGRPCLFVPGLQDMNEIPTVAGISVLSHVARIAADYDATIEVPTSRSLVMTAARETVQAAYLSAGRPEAYSDDRIYYVTEEQFPYVAYLTGYMVREKPAACFYAGTFFAESLILAETGNSIGAIQIAGTAEASQLPFFVAACDYTLIGEELFAASAYLSGDPHQLGSLKGQDAGKLLAAVLLTIGSLVATAAAIVPQSPVLVATLHFFKEVLLGKGSIG